MYLIEDKLTRSGIQPEEMASKAKVIVSNLICCNARIGVIYTGVMHQKLGDCVDIMRVESKF